MPSPSSAQPSGSTGVESLARTVGSWQLHPCLTAAVQDVGLTPTPLLTRVLTRRVQDFPDCLVDSRTATGLMNVLGTAESIWKASGGGSGTNTTTNARGKQATAAASVPPYSTPAAIAERHHLMALYACQCLLSAASDEAEQMISHQNSSANNCDGGSNATSEAPLPTCDAKATASTTAGSSLLPPGFRSPHVACIFAESHERAALLFDIVVDLAECCGLDVSYEPDAANPFAAFDVNRSRGAIACSAGSNGGGDDGDDDPVSDASASAKESKGQHSATLSGGNKGTVIITTVEDYMRWAGSHTLQEVRVLLPHDSDASAERKVAPDKEAKEKEPMQASTPVSAATDTADDTKHHQSDDHSLSSANDPDPPTAARGGAGKGSGNAGGYRWVGIKVTAVVVEDIIPVQRSYEGPWRTMLRSIEAANQRYLRRVQELLPAQLRKAHQQHSHHQSPSSWKKSPAALAVDVDRPTHHLWFCMAPLACVSPVMRVLLSRRNRRYFPLLRTDPRTEVEAAGLVGSKIDSAVARSVASTYPAGTVPMRLLLQNDEKEGLELLRAILQQTQYFKRAVVMTHTKEMVSLQQSITAWGKPFSGAQGRGSSDRSATDAHSRKGDKCEVGKGSVGSGVKGAGAGKEGDNSSNGPRRVVKSISRVDRGEVLTDKILEWTYGGTCVLSDIVRMSNSALTRRQRTKTVAAASSGGSDSKESSNGNKNTSDEDAGVEQLATSTTTVTFDSSAAFDLMDMDCLIQMYPPQKSLLIEEWISYLQCLHTTINGEWEIAASLMRESSRATETITQQMALLHRGLSVSAADAAAATTAAATHRRGPCVIMTLLTSKDCSLVSHFLDQYFYSGGTGVVLSPAVATPHGAVVVGPSPVPSASAAAAACKSGASGGGAARNSSDPKPPPPMAPTANRANVPVLNISPRHPLFPLLLSAESEALMGRTPAAWATMARQLQQATCQKGRSSSWPDKAPLRVVEGSHDVLTRAADAAKARAVMDGPVSLRTVLAAKLKKDAAAYVRAGGRGRYCEQSASCVALVTAAASYTKTASAANPSGRTTGMGATAATATADESIQRANRSHSEEDGGARLQSPSSPPPSSRGQVALPVSTATATAAPNTRRSGDNSTLNKGAPSAYISAARTKPSGGGGGGSGASEKQTAAVTSPAAKHANKGTASAPASATARSKQGRGKGSANKRPGVSPSSQASTGGAKGGGGDSGASAAFSIPAPASVLMPTTAIADGDTAEGGKRASQPAGPRTVNATGAIAAVAKEGTEAAAPRQVSPTSTAARVNGLLQKMGLTVRVVRQGDTANEEL